MLYMDSQNITLPLHNKTNIKVDNKHNLHTSWIIWYHSPSDKSWSKDSYKSILEINTVEDYLVLENSWLNCLPSVSEGMFFIMRKLNNNKIIFPLWEDPNNKMGGYWSFKVDNEHSQEFWNKLCRFTIGETMCNENENSMQINGISISPKKTFCIIKIWNDNCLNQDISILSDKLSFLNLNEVKYSSHDKNLERDAEKLQRYKDKMRDRRKQSTGFNY